MNITKRGTAKILRNAAKNIEQFGWAKHTLGNEEIGFCAIGALYHSSESDDQKLAARKALRNFLGVYSIPLWNDSYSRTKTDVLKALRGAARYLEHGGKI